ncbi:MAG: hypothetical protein RL150_642 [Candidatus Parcubacteria bacterium]
MREDVRLDDLLFVLRYANCARLPASPPVIEAGDGLAFACRFNQEVEQLGVVHLLHLGDEFGFALGVGLSFLWGAHAI